MTTTPPTVSMFERPDHPHVRRDMRGAPSRLLLRCIFESEGVPEYLHEPLVKYLWDCIHPGWYLAAVLRNDLVTAITHAHTRETEHALGSLVRAFNRVLPGYCWGSPEAVDGWLARRRDAIHDARRG